MPTQDDVYRRLQRHLNRMPVPFPATESGVELRILKALFSPEDAQVALALSMVPEPVPVVARRLRRSMSPEQVGEALARMAERGVVQEVRSARGPRYGKTVFVVGFYEAQVNRLTEAFERDVKQYFDEAFGQALLKQPMKQLRTVPVNKPLSSPDRLVARYDHISEIVRTSKGPFASMNCICQQGQDLLAEPCRHGTDHDHCLTLGPAATLMVERGAGRFITRDEMLAKLEQADRDGLVLQPQNTENPLFVCCCCGCCCGVLTTAKKFPKPAEFFHSNYYAEVNAAECQECGACAARCQMDAVTVACDSAPVRVNRDHCIGCGLCVTTCPSGAMRLVAKSTAPYVPPHDTMALYQRMFRDRYGVKGLAEVVVKKAMGRPF
jgi:Na+-translocating ferredoxin:NAD+ oxidoreductase subunit B